MAAVLTDFLKPARRPRQIKRRPKKKKMAAERPRTKTRSAGDHLSTARGGRESKIP